MEYEYERDGDGAIAERLEVIATNLYILNKKIEEFKDVVEIKLGGFDEDNLNVTLYTDRPIQVSKVETIKEIPASEVPTGEEA